jgi:small subunit ribosomal protein S21
MAKAKEGESFESLLKRFNKEVDREGILTDYRKNRYFMKPSTKKHEFRRKKEREALRSL